MPARKVCGPGRWALHTGMSTHTASTVRRLALLALGLLVVLTGVGLGSTPASALPPNQPRHIEAHGYEDLIRVYVAPPVAYLGGADVTGYQVERTAQGQPPKTWNIATTAPLQDSTAVLNVHYTYRARASSAEGWSAWSAPAGAERSVSYHELDSFSSTTSFVNRQYQDFLGRPPTNAERANAVQNIDQKAWTPTSFLNMLIANGTRGPGTRSSASTTPTSTATPTTPGSTSGSTRSRTRASRSTPCRAASPARRSSRRCTAT